MQAKHLGLRCGSAFVASSALCGVRGSDFHCGRPCPKGPREVVYQDKFFCWSDLLAPTFDLVGVAKPSVWEKGLVALCQKEGLWRKRWNRKSVSRSRKHGVCILTHREGQTLRVPLSQKESMLYKMRAFCNPDLVILRHCSSLFLSISPLLSFFWLSSVMHAASDARAYAGRAHAPQQHRYDHALIYRPDQMHRT